MKLTKKEKRILATTLSVWGIIFISCGIIMKTSLKPKIHTKYEVSFKENQLTEKQAKLVEILGSNNVYYQPPESVKIKYPAIVYSRSTIPTKKANNSMYKTDFYYSITLIGTNPQDETIMKLLSLDNMKYDRKFISDGMYHDVFTLYV